MYKALRVDSASVRWCCWPRSNPHCARHSPHHCLHFSASTDASLPRPLLTAPTNASLPHVLFTYSTEASSPRLLFTTSAVASLSRLFVTASTETTRPCLLSAYIWYIIASICIRCCQVVYDILAWPAQAAALVQIWCWCNMACHIIFLDVHH